MLSKSLIQKYYDEEDNYYIEDNASAEEKDLAVIYFSSIGLNFDDNSLINSVKCNYYELQNNKIQRATKHVFVRDLWQAFYVNGINHQLNSIEKTIEYLNTITRGYRIITVGMSAGGYMAIIAGIKLNAEYVLSLSGLLDIKLFYEASHNDVWNIKDSHPLPNITHLVSQTKVMIFQFWGAKCFVDIDNITISRRFSNMKIFLFDSNIHCVPMGLECLRETLNLDINQLKKLHSYFSGKLINRLSYQIKILPWFKIVKYYRKNWLKPWLKKISQFLFAHG